MMRPGGMQLIVMPIGRFRARDLLTTRARRPWRGGGEEAFGLGLAGYVDDASPAVLDHAGQHGVRELTYAGEIERHAVVPSRFRRIEGQGRAAAAGVVDQDVDVRETVEGGAGEPRGRIFLHDVGFDDDGFDAPGRDDFPRQFFEQLPAPRRDADFHAFRCEAPGNRAAYALARACHQRRFFLELQIQNELLYLIAGWQYVLRFFQSPVTDHPLPVTLHALSQVFHAIHSLRIGVSEMRWLSTWQPSARSPPAGCGRSPP